MPRPYRPTDRLLLDSDFFKFNHPWSSLRINWEKNGAFRLGYSNTRFNRACDWAVVSSWAICLPWTPPATCLRANKSTCFSFQSHFYSNCICFDIQPSLIHLWMRLICHLCWQPPTTCPQNQPLLLWLKSSNTILPLTLLVWYPYSLTWPTGSFP